MRISDIYGQGEKEYLTPEALANQNSKGKKKKLHKIK